MKKFFATLFAVLFSTMALAAVNVNTATEKELESLNGIGPVKAKAIVDYRKKNGAFKSLEDLKKVDGIGDATFDSIKKDVSLAGKTTVAAPEPKKDEPKKEDKKADKAVKEEKKAPAKEEKKADKPAKEEKAKKEDKKAEKPAKEEKKADDKAKKDDKKSEKADKPAKEDKAKKDDKKADDKKADEKKDGKK